MGILKNQLNSNLGLKGETPVDEGFFRLLGDKENFRKIFNKLPAYIPAAVGLGAASQNKNGGSTPKAQVGDNVAAIASQMEANEEDGGRPPLGVVDHIRALFDEEGLCRDNTCVETVKDFYSKAGVKAMPKDVYNNREFLKNFKDIGFFVSLYILSKFPLTLTKKGILVDLDNK